MTDVADRVRGLLETRIAELETEERQLKRVLESLGAAHTTSSGAPRRARHGRVKPRRVGRGQRPQQLLDAIRDNPGAPGAELARIIGVGSSQVYALIGRAQADKLIVKKGKGYALKG